jgi:hypothetical protein
MMDWGVGDFDNIYESAGDEALNTLRSLLEERLAEVKTGKIRVLTTAQIGQMARARLGRN